MDMKKNEIPRSDTESKKRISQQGIMMSDLLSAISETEYPQYILEAIEIIRNWIHDVINKVNASETSDMFNEFFDVEEEEPDGFDDLFERLKGLEEFADVVPNSGRGSGKPDTLIISLGSGDYEGGVRAAIDHAAVFNRPHCKRVWIISDNFIFGDTVKFIPHVDALAEQGITLRFILVTAWGWVELPLSESSATKNQFLWKTQNQNVKRRRRK